MRKITLSGGPLDGKTFRVPEDASRIAHHAVHDGWYDGEGRWNPDVFVQLVADTSALTAAEAAPHGVAEFIPADLSGLRTHARLGRRVVIVAHKQEAARHLWDAATEGIEGATRVVRSSGRERVEFESGGSIIAVGVNTRGIRGVTADVLYVDNGVTDASLATVMPALSASTVGLVIRHPEDDA